MKKTIKLVCTLAIFGLATTAIFAQQKGGEPDPKKNPRKPPVENLPPQMPAPHSFGFKECSFDDEIIIGTVASVDLQNNTIAIVNTDGKNLNIVVTPFARIHPTPKPMAKNPNDRPDEQALPNPNYKPFELNNIKKGDWVLVKKFNTDTKSIVAGSILVFENR